MKMSRIATMFAAAALSASPALAAPTNPASSLSISKSPRAATAIKKKSDLAGGGLIIGIVAVVVVVVGIVLISDGNGNSDSN